MIAREWTLTGGQFAVNDSAARLVGTAYSVIIVLLTYTVTETANQYIPTSLPAPSLRYVTLVRFQILT
jgi:hypothetical protein